VIAIAPSSLIIVQTPATMSQPLQPSHNSFADSEQLHHSVLTETEQHQILVEWNQTQAEYPKDKCIHQLFEEQVERSPDAIAIVFENEKLTYRELNQRANQLAHYLQTLGVGSEVLVGICVERSLEMVIGILGILKAGGAYVPLDPAYPSERLAFMLEDSAVSVLLTHSQLAKILPAYPTQRVYLDKDWKDIAQQSQENLVQDTKAGNLAYVIYTSGSTGTPKGVLVEHQGVVNLVCWHQEAFAISPTDRTTQLAGFTFDASVWEIWSCLTAGASLYIANEQIRLSPLQLQAWLIANNITVSFLPTVLAESILSLDWSRDITLRILLTGGDKLQYYPASSIPFKVVNNYGPTENTVVTTSGLVPANRHTNASPCIGKTIANTQVYILDRHLQPVPIGVSGELYIGGDGLARGYLNHPELTAEKFMPNPFSDEPGARLYKTGDLARYLPDGNIEFLGRIDHQVKIRGFRIELGEVEATLTQHPAVHQAVVVVREDVLGDKRLVAYCVTQPQAISARELRKFLQQQLPQYMVPSYFVLLDVLPLTPNGKVDRRALPAPEKARLELKNSFVAPRTSTETTLAEIWTKVLRLDQVGIHDEFLELGGHSLLAMQIISRITAILKVELSITKLFTASTIAGLAKQIEANRQEQSLLAPSIQIVTKNQPLPLSYTQERLWFLAQLEPSVPVYNEPFTIRFPGTIDTNALEKAMNEMIRRHESLRTRFITVEGQPFQIIDPPSAFGLRVVDLRQLPLEQREPEALQIATLEAKQPFDLATDRLLRATLIQLADDDYRLFVTMHHIIMDGISLFNVFLPELAALYEAIVHDQPLPLADLPTQYADFAVWQRQWLQGEALLHHLDYWKQQLSGELPTLQLPTDHSRLVNRSFRGARQCLALSQSLTEALKVLSQQEGVTLYMVLLAAFNALLYHYTGQDDVVIGTVSAGRNKSEIENAIGFFLNTLVLRTDLSGLPSFRQLLTRVREVSLDACTHEDLPFEQLVEALQLDRNHNHNHNPLFQVAFVLEPPVPFLDCDWTVSQLDIQTDTAKFDLTLELDERPEGIIGRFEYNTDLFDAATIVRMIGHFQTLLEGIVTNPDQQISGLPLLTEPERRQLLVEWNDTQTQYPQDKCIHQLFEEQVERSPDAVAVVFEDQQLTYQELNARANQLAHYLKTLGVKPEVLVGICVERSLDTIVGILGILKAGGAYVPLDPAYPQERLAFMLEDSAVSVLLTQSYLNEQLPTHLAQFVYLDKDWEDISQQREDNPILAVTAKSLAYVIYTSGSTGKPKGVLLEHQGLCNLGIAQQLLFGVNSDSRVLQFASLSFDASVWEIFMALTAGATLVLAPQDALMPGLPLLKLLQQQSITIVTLPPSALAVLPVERLPILQTIAVAGEACSADLVMCWAAERQFFNAYGPTESTVCATVSPCINGTEKLSIGRPIANTQIYILDRCRQPVPVGVAGELHISGDGLARGYLNRPELTAEKFIPNPFSDEPGSHLYKTGDLVRYLPDGNIEFIGRIDHQVKIRGFRIELGEVEAALSQHSDVQQVVVIVREDVPGDKRLIAYCVTQPVTVSARELREFVQQQLPTHMVPSSFVLLDALPLTPNGKIDRHALPLLSFSSESQQSFVKAQTPIEKILAQIWSDVLRLEKVGIHDNFFELGGDSILSIQIVACCNQAGLKLTPKDLFQHQTIAELAQVVNTTAEIQAEQGVVMGTVPLTPIQHWFLQQQLPESHYFNQSFIFEVSPDLKSDLLKQAIQYLLTHHDALRLRLMPTGDAWQQINVASEEAEFFNVVDLTTVTPDEQVATIEGVAVKLQTSLNLQSGPILRVTLFNLGANQPSRLLIVIHHLAVDGVSWRILLEDLAVAYQQLDQSKEIMLPAKTTSFQDWAIRLTDYAHSEIAAAKLNYWLAQVNDKALPLPVDFLSEGVTNTVEDSAEISVSLSIEQTTSLLREVPAAYNTQINDVLLTALVQGFAQWTGQRSLLIDLEGHGREDLFADVSLARTVGWFTAMFPVVLKLDESEVTEKVLKSIKEQLRQIPNHGIGYGILRYLSPDQQTRLKLQTLPQAEVCFNYLGQFDQVLTALPLLGLAKESIGLSVSPKGNRSHPLEINGFVAEGSLQFTWTYNRRLHQQATIEHLAQSFVQTLLALIDHCLLPEAYGYTPSDFPDVELSQAELDALMQTLNAEPSIDQLHR
jgi:amino acid adenylation domain-containing protein/non-ribosomal peptide synthase protein (TIGR01720 family)